MLCAMRLASKNDIGNKRNAARTGAIGLDLSKDDYSWVMDHLKAVADIVCKGRIVVVLEGKWDEVHLHFLFGIMLCGRTRIAHNMIDNVL